MSYCSQHNLPLAASESVMRNTRKLHLNTQARKFLGTYHKYSSLSTTTSELGPKNFSTANCRRKSGYFENKTSSDSVTWLNMLVDKMPVGLPSSVRTTHQCNCPRVGSSRLFEQLISTCLMTMNLSTLTAFLRHATLTGQDSNNCQSQLLE